MHFDNSTVGSHRVTKKIGAKFFIITCFDASRRTQDAGVHLFHRPTPFTHTMAPQLGDDEIDDLIYFARAGEAADLNEALATLAAREGLSPAQILAAAQDDGRSTCLHMATGNGNLGAYLPPILRVVVVSQDPVH